jgi:hypothetical protein
VALFYIGWYSIAMVILVIETYLISHQLLHWTTRWYTFETYCYMLFKVRITTIEARIVEIVVFSI